MSLLNNNNGAASSLQTPRSHNTAKIVAIKHVCNGVKVIHETGVGADRAVMVAIQTFAITRKQRSVQLAYKCPTRPKAY